MQHPEFERAEEIAEGLFTHQIEGIAFLLGRRRALLADDMGLGKTRQSIIAAVQRGGKVVAQLAPNLTGERSLSLSEVRLI